MEGENCGDEIKTPGLFCRKLPVMEKGALGGMARERGEEKLKGGTGRPWAVGIG